MATVRFTQTGYDGDPDVIRTYEVRAAKISAEDAVNVLCDFVERMKVALEVGELKRSGQLNENAEPAMDMEEDSTILEEACPECKTRNAVIVTRLMGYKQVGVNVEPFFRWRPVCRICGKLGTYGISKAEAITLWNEAGQLNEEPDTKVS